MKKKQAEHEHIEPKSERILLPIDYTYPDLHEKIMNLHKKPLKKIKIHKK